MVLAEYHQAARPAAGSNHQPCRSRARLRWFACPQRLALNLAGAAAGTTS